MRTQYRVDVSINKECWDYFDAFDTKPEAMAEMERLSLAYKNESRSVKIRIVKVEMAETLIVQKEVDG